MVAVVTGNGLGLERSSANVLGARGQLGSAALGRANDGVVVNAATGNLVISNRDEVLIGQGPDVAINRTYNSLGTYAGETDNWLTSTQRKIVLTGTANTAGSIATLTDWDGTVTTFDFVSTAVGYKAAAKPYSDDTLKIASGGWTWTEGKTRLIQKFNNGIGGRITSSVDADGKTVTYTYSLATTAGVLTKITTANSTTGQLGVHGADLR